KKEGTLGGEKKKVEGKGESEKCPGPNHVKHRTAVHDFTYESWVKPKDPGHECFLFGRCVYNKNKKGMFVDWKKTLVKGYARPVCHAEIESPEGKAELTQTALWFGAAPEKIDTKYREVKKGKPRDCGPLQSRIRMSVPRNRSDPEKTLVAIDVEFTS